jgi:two-component system CheB/CheR fusion protein
MKLTNDFSGYVVGIGASAGGLEALEKFFDACPIDTGAVFVVIQHLSPDHKSMMSNLLARHTTMPVNMVEQNTQIEANHVYLIPPAAIMSIKDGYLHLTPKSPRGLTLPIDIFFASLAENYGDNAIGIVLSGTGSDGTRGASAINALGGFLLAQDPITARFDGMPKSFISTGFVDAILPPEDLPNRVVAHIKHLIIEEPIIQVKEETISRINLTYEEVLERLMQLIQQVSGIDFREYKSTTVMRRIERRMQVRRVTQLEDYLELLDTERGEVMTLRQELLISVTSFFRDTDAFSTLTVQAITEIIASKQNGDVIRIWTAGCSTGEEPYSVAMLFLEAFEREKRFLNLKIFATDVNQQNIDFAAIGSYSEAIIAELSPQRLERFFEVRMNTFVVKNELRQCIVFARHNLLTDPPFTKMDLVTCRNTLIYFKNAAQERALRRLQYAIALDGFLFLGSSESLSASNEGLKVINAKHKLFQRTDTVAPMPYDMGNNVNIAYQSNRKLATLTTKSGKLTDNMVIDGGISTLMSIYAPPALIINSNHEIVHLFGNVQPYLSFREGLASLQLGRILPAHLIPIVSTLLYKSAKTEESLISDVIKFKTADNTTLLMRLRAQPITLKSHERFMLLCFEAQSEYSVNESSTEPFNIDTETIERIELLENDLAATRESLQAMIEELEAANEELQATNEELMASNEELQSSNEELQSVNEELNTVNTEYQEKMMILNQLNADLDGMSRASGVATIFVDENLNLTRFSQDAVQIFKLRSSDLGRRLDDFAHTLKYPTLIDDIENALQLQHMTECEVLSNNGQIFLARILPYFIPSSTTRGAVASFVDITAFHDVKRLQAILDALPEHIAVLDPDGSIGLVNEAWRRFAIANGDPDLLHTGPGANYFDACKATNLEDGKIAEQASHGLKSVLEGNSTLFSTQYPCHSPTEQRWFVMNVAPVKSYGYGAVVSHINISSWYLSNNMDKDNHE